MSLISRYLDPSMIERLNHLSLTARSVVEGSTGGAHRSPLKGASIEFRQHRFYVPGDEPRRLDWRVLARTDRPYIKEYDEETNLRGMILLDCSGSMAYGAGAAMKFDYAARVVAALAYLMLGQSESVGLGLFRGRVEHWLAPRAGTGHLSRVIDALERAAPQGKASVGQAMHEAADRLERRSLVVAVSDLFGPAEQISQGLAHLRHERHEAMVLQVIHRDEVDFPFRHWARFRGLEGEQAQLCEASIARQTYLENFRRHQRSVHERCRGLNIGHEVLMTDQPLIDELTRVLRVREGAPVRGLVR